MKKFVIALIVLFMACPAFAFDSRKTATATGAGAGISFTGDVGEFNHHVLTIYTHSAVSGTLQLYVDVEGKRVKVSTPINLADPYPNSFTFPRPYSIYVNPVTAASVTNVWSIRWDGYNE